jgi:hypothetical protein
MNVKSDIKNPFGALLVVLIFVLLAFGSTDDVFGSISPFRQAKSIEEAALVAEKYLNDYLSEYNDLCGKAKNRSLREKFLALEKKVADLPSQADNCENLDYDKQRSLRNYIENGIKKRPVLKNLIEGNIDCWN